MVKYFAEHILDLTHLSVCHPNGDVVLKPCLLFKELIFSEDPSPPGYVDGECMLFPIDPQPLQPPLPPQLTYQFRINPSHR